MIREGDLDAIEKWFEDNPEPSKDMYITNGVSIAHWAASAENIEVCTSPNSQLRFATFSID